MFVCNLFVPLDASLPLELREKFCTNISTVPELTAEKHKQEKKRVE
jgi:hypothetical protein